MLVFVQLSSMNTSCAGSNIPCLRIQRRRSRATSARFCSAAYKVFFEADVASIEEPPNRTTAARDSPLPHRRNQLVQRQIRLPGDQTQQKPRMFLQRRCAAATRLCRNADIPELPHAVAETLETPRLCCLGAGMEDTDVVGPVRRLLRPAASGPAAAAPPSSVRNCRRLTSSMGSSPNPLCQLIAA